MLVNVKTHLGDPDIRALLDSAVLSEPELLEEAVRDYETDAGKQLYGYRHEEAWIGLIGFYTDPDGIAHVEHLAVHPQHRGLGYGRGLLLELIEMEKPVELRAVTDEEAAEFFRSVGFAVTGTGSASSGFEQFECVYRTEEEE